MQSIKLNSSHKLVPLDEIFTTSAVSYANNLTIAAKITPNNDWGATDLEAAAASGVKNAGVQCAAKCKSMPWLYTGCTNPHQRFNSHVAGGGASPCSGYVPSAAQQYPALAATAKGMSLLQ